MQFVTNPLISSLRKSLIRSFLSVAIVIALISSQITAIAS